MGVALLIIPPLIKVTNGPQLGPALLKSVAEARGHHVRVLDLNLRWFRDHTATSFGDNAPEAVGDHAPIPRGIPDVEARFFDRCTAAIPGQVEGSTGDDRAPSRTLVLSHVQVNAAADNLAAGDLGRWMCGQIEPHLVDVDLVGFSVMYSGQVLAALTATRVLTAIRPDTPVVWGGSHILALKARFRTDLAFRRYGVDHYVTESAPDSLACLLDVVGGGAGEGCGTATGDAFDGVVRPSFEEADLSLYTTPLNLPAQTRRGCVYGRCGYCTYPAIEGPPVDLGFRMLEVVTQQAEKHDAVITLKDSLVGPRRLVQVAACVGGRVSWAACTKIHSALDVGLLKTLVRGGCRTLEFGLETLLPESQRLITKRQSGETLRRNLEACALAGVFPVVNVMTGFPGEDAGAAEEMLRDVRDLLEAECGGWGLVKHNIFELAPLAPLAGHPGIEITASWPWASMVAWTWRGK
jgi:hypothetical protein